MVKASRPGRSGLVRRPQVLRAHLQVSHAHSPVLPARPLARARAPRPRRRPRRRRPLGESEEEGSQLVVSPGRRP